MPSREHLLKGVVVVDLTSRLPGPYAGYLLSKMGAHVIKLENSNYPDAFSDERLHQLDPIFKVWYENFNAPKEKVSLNFQTPDALERLQQIIKEAHIILTPKSAKVIQATGLKTIAQNHPLSIIQVGGGQGENKSMHDLNALAQTGVFHLHAEHSNEPPFLPMAGFSYGQQIATEALACHLECQKTLQSVWHEIYLDQTSQMQFQPMWSETLSACQSHLHSGKFPCYNLYQLNDGGVLAVAAVEDKFWEFFIKTFELPLTLDDRYDTSKRVQQLIQDKLATFSTDSVREKIKGHDSCVTIVTPLA
jgi:alpha-methylacyl-CoA racemase